MNAYDFLISGQTATTRQGDMALGHLMADLTRSPHAAAMAGPWPAGWRRYGCAIITPAGTLLSLTRDDSGLGVRGHEYTFTIVRVGALPMEGVQIDAAYHLVAAGIAPIRAAVWSALEEWGSEQDRADRDALL